MKIDRFCGATSTGRTLKGFQVHHPSIEVAPPSRSALRRGGRWPFGRHRFPQGFQPTTPPSSETPMAGPPARHGLGTVEQFILGFLGACTVFVAALDPVAAAGVLGSFYVLWRVVG